MFCSKCGKYVEDSMNFCSACGAPVVRTVQPAVQPVQPVQPAVQPVQPAVQPVQPAVQPVAQPMIQPMQQAAQQAVQQTVRPMVQQATRQVIQPVQQAAQQAVQQTVQPMAQQANAAVSQGVHEVINSFAVNVPGEHVIGYIGGVFANVRQAASKVQASAGTVENARKSGKGRVGVVAAIIFSVVMTGLWIAQLFLMKNDVDNIATKILGYLTFASAGLNRGVAGFVGGIIGRGVVASALCTVCCGGIAAIGRGVRNLFAGGKQYREAGQKGSMLLFFVGAVVAMGLYIFFAGNLEIVGSVAAIAGILVALRSLGTRGGFLYKLLSIFVKRDDNGQRVTNHAALRSLMAGLAAGYAFALLLVVTLPALDVDTSDVSFLSISALASEDYDPIEDFKGTYSGEAILPKSDELGNIPGLEFTAKFDDIVIVVSADGTAVLKTKMKASMRYEVYGYIQDAKYTADVETKPMTLQPGDYKKDEHGYTQYYTVDYTQKVKIDATVSYSGPGYSGGDGSEVPMTYDAKYHITFSLGLSDKDKPVIYDGLIHIDPPEEDASLAFMSDVQFLCTTSGWHTKDEYTDASDKEGEEGFDVDDDIITEIGIGGGVAAIAGAVGAIGGGGGPVGGGDGGSGGIPGTEGPLNPGDSAGGPTGAAASGGESAEEEKKRKAKYRMKVLKKFGDTMSRFEYYYLYARIVEMMDDGSEKDCPQFSENIRIYSEDGFLNVTMADGLTDNYKAATVSVVNDAQTDSAVVCFEYVGPGGRYTNHMRFKIAASQVVFYQNNIALEALDPEGVGIPFTLEGFSKDPSKVQIQAFVKPDTNYAVAVTPSENAPGTYFACIADMNEDPGESGSYSCDVLHVTATEDNVTAEGTLEIYRVNPGIVVGTDVLDCYRVPKQSAVGKDVNYLTEDDFDIACTKANICLMKFDPEEHQVYYRPVEVTVEVVPQDPDDKLMKERLDGIGITAILNGSNDSMAQYSFFCSKGWLEPPIRVPAILKLSAVDGDDVYTKEHPVLLQSQKYRPTNYKTDFDIETESWFDDCQFMIRTYDLMDYLGGTYMMIDVLRSAYNEHYGYDQILVTQLKKSVEDYFRDVRRYSLKRRQEAYVAAQERDLDNANSTGFLWSKSFSMIQEEYLDTWGGICVRIGTGLATGGLSEAVFFAMSANAGVCDYMETTPLTDRNDMDMLIAGVTPVAIDLAMGAMFAGTLKLAGKTAKVMIPQQVRSAVKNWVIDTAVATYKKIPPKTILAIKNVYESLRLHIDAINSLRYDPRTRCFVMKEVATHTKDLVKVANAEAHALQKAVRAGKRTAKGELKSIAQRCNELEAAQNMKSLKAAMSNFKKNPTPENEEALKKIFFKSKNDMFTINKIKQDGLSDAVPRKASAFRAEYNQLKRELMDEPVEKCMRKYAAEAGNCSEDAIEFIKKTGNSMDDLEKGYTIPADTDVSPVVRTKSGQIQYFSQAKTNEIVSKGYCDGVGIPYKDATEALKHSNTGKCVGVAKGGPEAYHAYDKLGTTNQFNKIEMSLNKKVMEHKMISGYNSAERTFNEICSSPDKIKSLYAELEQYQKALLEGKTPPKISSDAMSVKQLLESQMESIHQVKKTYKLNTLKDIQGQANGFGPAFDKADNVFVELCNDTEVPGRFRIDIGELDDSFAALGTDYESAARKMIDSCERANANCGNLNIPSFRRGATTAWTVGSTLSGQARDKK